MADKIQKAIFHGPIQGLIDIKPLDVSFKFPFEILFYPLLIIAIGLFCYILFQTLKIKQKKAALIEPIKEALLKLDKYPCSLVSPKDKAEYLAETLKCYLFKLKINKALALESSISIENLSGLLNMILAGSNKDDRTNISRDIISILYRLETIEYSLALAETNTTLDNCLNEIRASIYSIEKIKTDLLKLSTKTKKAKVRSEPPVMDQAT